MEKDKIEDKATGVEVLALTQGLSLFRQIKGLKVGMKWRALVDILQNGH
jgi:hypothetical protein